MCRDALFLLISSASFVLFLHPSKQRLRSPTHWPPPGWVYFAEQWNHKSFVLSPALPKVFLMAGLKYLRGKSFLCSGKTSAPAVLTVIPVRQHSMTLFRNINIYTTHMLIPRTSKYPAESVLFRNATPLLDCDCSNDKTLLMDVKGKDYTATSEIWMRRSNVFLRVKRKDWEGSLVMRVWSTMPKNSF